MTLLDGLFWELLCCCYCFHEQVFCSAWPYSLFQLQGCILFHYRWQLICCLVYPPGSSLQRYLLLERPQRNCNIVLHHWVDHLSKVSPIVLTRVHKCIIKIDYAKVSPIVLPRVHKRITKIDYANMSPIALPRAHKRIMKFDCANVSPTVLLRGTQTHNKN